MRAQMRCFAWRLHEERILPSRRRFLMVLWPPAAISGTVTDGHGDPVVGAYVRVLMKIGIGGRDRLAAGPPATTDDLGRYRIANLTRGAYVVALVSVSDTWPSTLTQGALSNLPTQSLASVI